MSRFAALAFFFILSLAIVILPLPCLAQVPDPVTMASAPIPGAGHHYIGTGGETVNPADGSFSFNLPFTPAAGRQLSIPFAVTYASPESFYVTNGEPGSIPSPGVWWGVTSKWMSSPFEINGWGYELPSISGTTSLLQAFPNFCGSTQQGTAYILANSNLLFRGADNIQRGLSMGDVFEYFSVSPCSGTQPNRQVNTGQSIHGIAAAAPWATPSGAAPVTVFDQSGTVYKFRDGSTGMTYGSVAWGLLAQSITDRNGNQITANGNGYKDTMGRNVISWTGIGNDGDQLTVAGLGGNVKLHWAPVNASFTLSGTFASGSDSSCHFATSSVTLNEVSEIDLPNGRTYLFSYAGNPYGRVSKITFPDGGYVRYRWGLNPQSQGRALTGYLSGDMSNGTIQCIFKYDVPAIRERWVSYDGQTEPLHQSFDYGTQGLTVSGSGVSWTSKTTTVTATDSISGQTTVTTYTYGPTAHDPTGFGNNSQIPPVPVETSVKYADGSGTVAKTINKTWASSHALSVEQTVLETGQNTTTVRCYDGSEQVTDLYEFGLYPDEGTGSLPSCAIPGSLSPVGPLLRHTITAYHPFFGGLPSAQPGSDGNIIGTHIVNAADTVTVADGVGNTVKQTTFGYSNVVQSSGTGVGLVTAPGPDRGNVVSIVRRIDNSNSATTTYTYYDTGQPHTMTDPCGNATCADMAAAVGTTACDGASVSGHITSYCYGDNYAAGTGTPPAQTNAYLTKVTSPSTGVAHSKSFSWGYNDGQIRSIIDQNQQATYFYYDDPGLLARLTEIDYPDGGQTTVAYDDSPYSATAFTPNYKVTQTISSTVNKVTSTSFDGLGRQWLVRLISDPQGTDYTATIHDGFGRVRYSYNPTRCNPPTANCGETTSGFTTTSYDTLDRVSSVLKQDGSATSMSYSGLCTTVRDETGRLRKSCSDGLGRLTEVDEPGTGAGLSSPGTASISVNGNEKSTTISATAGTGTVTFGGSDQSVTVNGCPNTPPYNCWYTVWDGGQIQVSVNGFTKSGGYGATDTGASIATAFASAFNSDSGSPVNASASNGVLTLTSKATGLASNYTLSASVSNWNTQYFSHPSFGAVTSGATLTGGQNATTVYDSGTVSVTVIGPSGNFTASAPYTSTSSSSSIASTLASALSVSGSPVTATPNGNGVTITSITAGAGSNYPFSASTNWNSQQFSTASFTVSPPSGALAGGADSSIGTAPLVTQYRYDALGNLTCAVQKGTDSTAFNSCSGAPATWRPRSFVYDSLSRLTNATNPENGTITYSYDANGNLASRVAPKPNTTGTAVVTTKYTYDVLNRLTQKAYVNMTTAKALYGYDGSALTGCNVALPTITSPTNLVGQVSAMCSSLSSSRFSYDSMGRMSTDVRNNRGSGTSATKLKTTYSYWLDGSLKTMTYPSGDILSYTVGGAGRTTQVTDSANNFVTAATYAPPGTLAGMINGSGIITSNSYNNRLQPILLSAGLSGQSPVFSLCYDFHLQQSITNGPCSFSASSAGDNGNVYQIINNVSTDATHQSIFQYDLLNRISQANSVATSGANCWGEVYTVDTWGNLTNRSGPSGMGTCYTEPLSTSATAQNRLASLTYDIAGNVLTDATGSAVTYDGENRIATDAGYTYSYDANGSRTEKASGTTGTMYWPGPGGAILTETDLTGAINEEYVFFDGARIARIDRPSGAVHYYFSDQLGSASVITDGSANVQERYFYYPYGGVLYAAGNDPNHYKFTGKERDAESGLDNFGARYDASSLGRFMTPDWAAKPTTVPYAMFGDPQTLNLYAYVGNNPMSRADADGHCADHYKDGTCKVNVDPKTGEAGAKAGKQLEGVLNKYDKSVNDLSNKTKFDIKDSKGNIIGSMSGKEIKAVWNGTHFSITDKTFNNGGAGGGTSGSWKLFGGFSGKSELSPEAVKAYVSGASGRNEDPLVGLSTMTFHELAHETHFGEALTSKYPVTDKISPEREAGTSSAGRAMSGTVDAPFDCSIPAGGCQ